MKRQEREQRMQEAYSLWKQGKKISEIATIMDLSKNTVCQYLLNFPEYVEREDRIEARKHRMKEYFSRGMSDREIAQLEKCSIATVCRHRANTEYIAAESEKQPGNLPPGFEWKWPVTVNRLLKAAGKKTQPVPEHSREAERQWFIA